MLSPAPGRDRDNSSDEDDEQIGQGEQSKARGEEMDQSDKTANKVNARETEIEGKKEEGQRGDHHH